MSEPINGGGPSSQKYLLRDWFAGMALNEKEFQMLRDQYFAAHPKEAIVSVQTLRVFNADAILAELAKGRP